MSSISQRHTYYGGTTTGTAPATSSHQHSSSSYRHKRKQVTFGPYIVGSTLGEGEFGKVKLGWSKTTGSNEVPKQVAIKLIRRDTVPKNSDKEVKIYREINALKHLTHPNIVRLEEVLQNSKYIGIVLEYASGGEFYRYIQKKRRLKEHAACRLFAQLISGVHYMHSKGLVHRDLKLENLLLDKNENLLITDFGFVNEFNHKNELMKTSCGSPCYAAPELVVTTKPYEARKADIWSCGVIMYAMLAGYLPWDDDSENPEGDDIAKLYHYITKTPLKFPEYINPVPRDLLRRILVSNPKKRLNLRQVEQHQWLQPHCPFLTVTPEEWDRTLEGRDLFRPPPLKSQVRPHSNCSTSSAGSKGERRNSFIMDSSLYSQPVPPQESQSHAIAKPSSPSSELRHSPVRRSHHSRSNSAASIALQAVVDAEREHHHHHHAHFTTSISSNSLHQDSQHQSTPPHQPQSIQHSANSSGARLQAFGMPRSTTHNGVSSLMNRNSVIIEASPQKGSAPIVGQNGRDSFYSDKTMLPPTQLSPPSSSTQLSGFKVPISASTTSVNGNNHTNHHHLMSHRRPRPTSYHPTSYAAHSEFNINNSTVPGVTMMTHSANVSTMLNGSTLASSAPTIAPDTVNSGNNSASSSHNSSPQIVQRSSFTISKPSVDLQIVAGDLIKSSDNENGGTVTKKIHEQVEDANNKAEITRQRRQSQRYSAVIYDKIFGAVSEEAEEVAVIEKSVIAVEAVAKPEAEKPSATRTDTEPHSKEQARKFYVEKREKKRFSFLSFYSSYNTSKSSLESNVSKEHSMRKLSNSERSIKSTHSLSSSKSKNVTRASSTSTPKKDLDKRIPSQSSSSSSNNRLARHSMIAPKTNPVSETVPSTKRNHRASLRISSLSRNQQLQTQNPQERPREQSTAKKVMDFFKRRSMRL